MSMIVIFAGTWAQIDHGIWDVQARYFHSYFTWIDFQLFLPRPNLAAGEKPFPGALPMLGGYSLIILLLLNLLAAHTVRFKLSWKRSGVILIHLGLIMLLVGELVTSQFAVESQMPIDEGSYANYSQDIRESEVAIVEHKTDQNDNVTVIPESKLTPGVTISDSRLPFDV